MKDLSVFARLSRGVSKMEEYTAWQRKRYVKFTFVERFSLEQNTNTRYTARWGIPAIQIIVALSRHFPSFLAGGLIRSVSCFAVCRTNTGDLALQEKDGCLSHTRTPPEPDIYIAPWTGPLSCSATYFRIWTPQIRLILKKKFI